MRNFNFLILVGTAAAALVGCTKRAEFVKTSNQSATDAQGIVIVLPAGFEPRPKDNLYYHPRLRASISLNYGEGKHFDEVAAEFTKENLLTLGLEVDERVILESDGRRTLYVQGRRLKGPYPQTCAITLFPTSRGCVQLAGTYPTDAAAEIGDAVRKSLIEARFKE